MLGLVRRDLFTHIRGHDGGVIASEYYTITYTVGDFISQWNSEIVLRLHTLFHRIVSDCAWDTPYILGVPLDSPLNFVPFRGLTRFCWDQSFEGHGAAKCTKREYIDRARFEWRVGTCDALLVHRQNIYKRWGCPRTQVLFGKRETLLELAKLVAQSCVLYTADFRNSAQ